MTTPFETVGQSELGAYIQSELGARTLGGMPDDVIVAVLASDATLYYFNASDMSTMLGPLDLGISNTDPRSLILSDDAEKIFSSWDGDEIACHDTNGDEIWNQTPASGEGFGHGIGNDGTHIWTPLESETDSVRDTVSIQSRNPANGNVVNTTEIFHNDDANYSLCRAWGLCVMEVAGTHYAYILVIHDETVSSNQDRVSTLYKYTLNANGTATLDDSSELSRVVDVGGPPASYKHHFLIEAGSDHIFSNFFDQAGFDTERLDAYDPDDLSDVNASDGTPHTASLFGRAFGWDDLSGPTEYVWEGLSVVQKRTLGGTLEASSESRAGATVEESIVRQQVSRNHDIVLTAEPDENIDGNSAYSNQLSATGSPTDWILLSAPSGMTISATGLVEWASPSPAGDATVRAYARADDKGWDQIEWTIKVALVAPTVNAIADDNVTNFFTYNETPTLSAGDDDVVWTLETAPAGATINASTGAISWPLADPVGDHDFTVRATNPVGFDEESWTVTVDSL